MTRIRFCFLTVMAVVPLAGCQADRLGIAELSGGNAALVGQFVAFDGQSGRGISFAAAARRCAQADVIFFGEEHYNPVCNALEAQLLNALADRHRPIALAMEFFETDTQDAASAYLAGRMDEQAFLKATRQGDKYLLSHRPLIELCKRGHMAVIAANAPRRLTREYRASGLSYDQFRAKLSPADQSLLAAYSHDLEGPYWQRYLEATKDHPMPASAPSSTSAPSSMPAAARSAMPAAAAKKDEHPMKKFYRVQLMWDDTMAESVAKFREQYPDHRVMLVVGGFHVAQDGGTAVKFRERRPSDRVCVVVFRGAKALPTALDAADRHVGDVVFYGLTAAAKPSE